MSINLNSFCLYTAAIFRENVFLPLKLNQEQKKVVVATLIIFGFLMIECAVKYYLKCIQLKKEKLNQKKDLFNSLFTTSISLNSKKVLGEFQEGLNFIGKCKAKECQNYDKFVITSKGLGDFNIVDIVVADLPCSSCQSLLATHDLVVSSCKFRLQWILNVKARKETFELLPQENAWLNAGKWKLLKFTKASRLKDKNKTLLSFFKFI